MLDNNLIFSLFLSIINTVIFALMTNRDDFEQRKQDYIMLFGITFLSTFILKTCVNSPDSVSPTRKLDILSKSSRPPF